MTILRLELSAALLLSRLLAVIIETLSLASPSCLCWTDSMVTLHWLAKPPVTWKTFVANRVSEIHNRLPRAHWKHVPSSENPADCASCGLLPSQIIAHKLWWEGPA
ncbi:uncharacterized protein LOC143178262 [Calliopsis andreniformis]|uniref:uncharacterized protein LOC143178262 n=1 Tax=Calliopsis andreniformis TaxID=337506 RepID=UPI003FCC5AED